MNITPLRIITFSAACLAILVIMLGAYTRLTDAGLGCPDWPGCYGKLVLPHATSALQDAQSRYPEVPIESRKAWTEMVHRYAAGTLAVLLLIIGSFVLLARLRGQNLPWHLPIGLWFLVLFQAALGMWTVTLKLLPLVVMGHLLGGILILACLSRFGVQISSIKGKNLPLAHLGLGVGALVVFLQIALGGWVSSNYAGIACIGFPTCNGFWLPPLDLAKGFNFSLAIGANYQGGLLDNEARVSIQFIHRIGAMITAVYLLLLSATFLKHGNPAALKRMALFVILLVIVQFTLGVVNVLFFLPLYVAVAHNGVAALLFTTLFCMVELTYRGGNDVP